MVVIETLNLGWNFDHGGEVSVDTDVSVDFDEVEDVGEYRTKDENKKRKDIGTRWS